MAWTPWTYKNSALEEHYNKQWVGAPWPYKNNGFEHLAYNYVLEHPAVTQIRSFEHPGIAKLMVWSTLALRKQWLG
jgi:hypothetical protein